MLTRLLDAGEKGDIPIQLSAFGRATPTDANALQVTRDGVATGLVSVPNRYMHSAVETVSLDDADKNSRSAGVRSVGGSRVILTGHLSMESNTA